MSNGRKTKLFLLVTLLLISMSTVVAEDTDNLTVSDDSNTTISTNENSILEESENIETTQNVIDNKSLSSDTVYNVNSYSDLVTTVNEIKSNGKSSENYTINLDNTTSDTYTIIETITWGETGQNTKNLTINGNGVTIDGSNINQFITISNGYILTLTNITIKNCYSNTSGGVLFNNGSLALNNVILSNSTASGSYSHGGAIYSTGNLTRNNSNFITKTDTIIDEELGIASNLSVDSVVVKNGYTINLTASVTDEDGNPVNTGKVTFKLNGNTIKVNGTALTVDVVDGVAMANFTVPNYSAKDYRLKAVYGDNIIILEENTTFTVIKSDPELVLTSITSNGSTGQITGMLLYEHGVGVDRETKVVVKLNGKTVTSTRITGGVINISFNTSVYKTGIHNLSIVFGENGCYNTVKYEGILAQNIKNTIITQQVSDKNQETIALRAYVVDSDGNSATNGSATFKINGNTIKVNGSAIKVNVINGVAEYNYTIPDYSAKNYTITAVASVDGVRYENKTTLTIIKTNTHIELNTITTSNGQTTITASILDERNNKVTLDTKVAVKNNGKTFASTKVSNGTINITLDTTLSTGNYTLTVIAGENNRYNPSTLNTTLTIK